MLPRGEAGPDLISDFASINWACLAPPLTVLWRLCLVWPGTQEWVGVVTFRPTGCHTKLQSGALVPACHFLASYLNLLRIRQRKPSNVVAKWKLGNYSSTNKLQGGKKAGMGGTNKLKDILTQCNVEILFVSWLKHKIVSKKNYGIHETHENVNTDRVSDDIWDLTANYFKVII